MRAIKTFVASLIILSASPVNADPVVPVQQLAVPYILSMSQPAVDIKTDEGVRQARILKIGPIFRSDPYDPPRPILRGDGEVRMAIASLAPVSVKHRIICEVKGSSQIRFVHERKTGSNALQKLDEAVVDDAAFGTVDRQFAFDFFPGSEGGDEISINATAARGNAWQFGQCQIAAGPAPAAESSRDLRTPPLTSLTVLPTKPYRISAAQPKVDVQSGKGAIRAGLLGANGYVHFTIGKDDEAQLSLNNSGQEQPVGGSISLIVARITPNKQHRIVCDLGGREEFTFNHYRAKPDTPAIMSSDDLTFFKSVTVKPDAMGLQSYDFLVGESGQDVIQLVPVTQKNAPFFRGCDVSIAP